jgi:hypothetical protein
VPTHVAAFRDSTQIVLPTAAVEGVREDLEARFRLTTQEGDGYVRFIASPTVIKEANGFLARHGISLP